MGGIAVGAGGVAAGAQAESNTLTSIKTETSNLRVFIFLLVSRLPKSPKLRKSHESLRERYTVKNALNLPDRIFELASRHNEHDQELLAIDVIEQDESPLLM